MTFKRKSDLITSGKEQAEQANKLIDSLHTELYYYCQKHKLNFGVKWLEMTIVARRIVQFWNKAVSTLSRIKKDNLFKAYNILVDELEKLKKNAEKVRCEGGVKVD